MREIKNLQKKELEKKSVYKLHRLMLSIIKKLNKLLTSSLSLTFPQFMVLNIIKNCELRTQKEIADWQEVSPAVINRVVKILHQKKILSFSPNPENMRERHLQLTPHGENLLTEARTKIGAEFIMPEEILSNKDLTNFNNYLDILISKYG